MTNPIANLSDQAVKALGADALLRHFDAPSSKDDHAAYAALLTWCDGRAIVPRHVVALVRGLQRENSENAPNLDVLLAYLAPSVFSLTELSKWSWFTAEGAKLAASIDTSWRASGRIVAADTEVLANEFWVDRTGNVLWAAERNRAGVLSALKKGIRESHGQRRVVFVYWKEQVSASSPRSSAAPRSASFHA